MIDNMRKHIYIIMLMLLGCIPQLRAQDDGVSVVKYEYWVDSNFDNRISEDVTAAPNEQVALENKEFSTSGLSAGIHRLYLRAMNSKNEWGNILMQSFYIDGDIVTRPTLKDIRKYRYMFNDGTMKYVDIATPSQNITDAFTVDMPDPTAMYLDKSTATFEFGVDANTLAVKMSRNIEYNFALQYENDQNGWCPPVQNTFVVAQELGKTAVELSLGSYINIDKPFKGNYVPFTFNLSKAGKYSLKVTDGTLNVLLFKSKTVTAGTEWLEFAELSPEELQKGYTESLDAGRYYAIVYTPERFDDGVAAKPNVYFTSVCATPEIIVNGDEVTIGGLETGVTYYYTLDGSEPTTQSTQYTAPFKVTESCVVKAIAVKDGQTQSAVAVQMINFGQGGGDGVGTTSRVKASFNNGTLTLSCETNNAVIYYGINQAPNQIYVEPVELTDNRPVYFYAELPGYGRSITDTLEISYFKCSLEVTADRDIRLSCPDNDSRIYYTTDGSEPTDNSDYNYGSVGFGYCTVKAFATAPYKLNSDTITFTPDAMYQGGTDPTYVNVPGKLSQAYEWLKTETDAETLSRSAKMIRVIGTINDDDIAYIQQMPDLEYIDLSECDVVSQTLPDRVFAESNIRYFCSPKNLTSAGSNLLAGCKRLGGIKWNSRIAVPEDILGGVDYPNLMLYVKSASYANGNLFHNVISNGVAANITLQDVAENGCFYAIDEFRAQKISYTRNFGMETLLNGESQGWETLALPFDVQTVTHETNGLCLPFASSNNETDKRYWLNTFADSLAVSRYNPQRGYQYIVSMPNNVEYSNEYILSGNVTFSATNTYVSRTNVEYTNFIDARAYSNYEYLEPSETRSTLNVYEAYDGHNPGSIFVPGVFGCKPFEAYIEYVQNDNNAPRRGPVIGIGDGTTGIYSVPVKYADDNVYSKDGKLYIYSEKECDMALYNLMGQKVRTVHLQVGENVIEGLPAGTYIVKGKKFMINYRR